MSFMICYGSLKFRKHLAKRRREDIMDTINSGKNIFEATDLAIHCPYMMSWVSEDDIRKGLKEVVERIPGKVSGYFLALKNKSDPKPMTISIDKDGLHISPRVWDFKLTY